MHPLLYRSYHFISHFISAGNAHGLHSPFVFDLYTSCVLATDTPSEFDRIEKVRQKLRNDTSVLSIEDYGAGAKNGESYNKSVASIASTALSNKKSMEFLYRIVQKYKPQHILELGTSLGLSSAYMALANPESKIETLEGAREIAAVAKKTHASLLVTNCRIQKGSIDQTLAPVLAEMKQVDFAYLDANHRYAPTMKYVESILPYCHENSFLLLDDIYWSREMGQAWKELKNKKEFGISIDFYDFGMLFLRQKQPKQHFRLKG